MPEPSQPIPAASVLTGRVFWILFLLIALAGVTLRVTDSAAWRRTGPDEQMYRRYVNFMDGYEGQAAVFPSDARVKRTGQRGLIPYQVKINRTGAMAMPEMTDFYLQTQRSEDTLAELPPTRFLYIYTSWLWKRAQFGDEPPLSPREIFIEGQGDDRSQDPDHRDPALASLHRVACLFTILAMLAGGLCAWRMFGRGAGLGVLALMAFDPVQLHFSQHALIDGFFLFWAVMCLWTTWECLQKATPGWLAAHTAALALMVMTKENSFFVYCALALVVVSNVWLKFGTITRRFVLLSIAGPLLGVTALSALAGGVDSFVEIYRSLVSKAQNLEYAKMTGDGPWYRYLIDLMTVSPIVLCLAFGALFALVPKRRELAFLAIFVVCSYAIMCNVKYGMNLRYASIWALPLRAAAFAMIWHVCAGFGTRQVLVACLLVAGLCAYEFRQFWIFTTDPNHPLYELVPDQMLRQVNIIKG